MVSSRFSDGRDFCFLLSILSALLGENRLKNRRGFLEQDWVSNGFGFSSFSSSVAAPSLVLNVDFNTCE